MLANVSSIKLWALAVVGLARSVTSPIAIWSLWSTTETSTVSLGYSAAVALASALATMAVLPLTMGIVRVPTGPRDLRRYKDRLAALGILASVICFAATAEVFLSISVAAGVAVAYKFTDVERAFYLDQRSS